VAYDLLPTGTWSVGISGPRPNDCLCSWGYSHGKEYLKVFHALCPATDPKSSRSHSHLHGRGSTALAAPPLR
jgi:hypothetical protein